MLRYDTIHRELTEEEAIDDLQTLWDSGKTPDRLVEFIISVSRTYLFQFWKSREYSGDEGFVYDKIADTFLETVERFKGLKEYIANSEVDNVIGLLFTSIKYSVRHQIREHMQIDILLSDDMTKTVEMNIFTSNQHDFMDSVDDINKEIEVPFKDIPLPLSVYLEFNYIFKGLFRRYPAYKDEVELMQARVIPAVGHEFTVVLRGSELFRLSVFDISNGKVFSKYTPLPVI